MYRLQDLLRAMPSTRFGCHPKNSHGPYFGKSRRLTHVIVARVIFSALWHNGPILLHWNTLASSPHLFSPPPPLVHFPFFFFFFFFILLATFLLHIYPWHSRTTISYADKWPPFLVESSRRNPCFCCRAPLPVLGHETSWSLSFLTCKMVTVTFVTCLLHKVAVKFKQDNIAKNTVKALASRTNGKENRQ